MGWHDSRRKGIQARVDRYRRTGENSATDRAKLAAARKEREKENAPFQARLNRYHAAWVAAGMPNEFPKMEEWEKNTLDANS